VSTFYASEQFPRGRLPEETAGEDLRLTLERERAYRFTLNSGDYNKESIAADFYDRFYDDEACLSSGGGVRTKTEIVADWRSGVPKVLSTEHYDFRVRIYDNGNTAVCYLPSERTLQIRDTPSIDYDENLGSVREAKREVAGCSPRRGGCEEYIGAISSAEALQTITAVRISVLRGHATLRRPPVERLEHGHISV
jgi:hypothetical protein